MNSNTYIKTGVGFLALSTIFFGYGAYTFAVGGEPASSITIKQGKPEASSYLPKAASNLGDGKAENITLSKSNTVVFRAVVSPLSAAKAQQELLEKSRELGSGKPIYLFLDTPGGDISAGSMLIDTARGLGRPVHTISSFAASMGFGIVQRLGKRYITPSGVLMAHRARVEGVGGQIPGEFLTAVSTIYRDVTRMEKQNAARLGISFEAYTALVKDEYWVSGEDAVEQNAADAVANIKCDASLQGSHEETYNTLFGPALVTFSNCPAIGAPLDVKFADNVDKAKVKELTSSYALLRKALR